MNCDLEWRHVYEILPKLAGSLEPEVDSIPRIPRAYKAEYLINFRSDLKTQIAESKEEAPEAWREDRDIIIDSLAIGLQKSMHVLRGRILSLRTRRLLGLEVCMCFI